MSAHSLPEILARARAELRINPTITVYTMVDGVEQRRPANPFAGVHAAFINFAEAAARAAKPLAELMENFRAGGRP